MSGYPALFFAAALLICAGTGVSAQQQGGGSVFPQRSPASQGDAGPGAVVSGRSAPSPAADPGPGPGAIMPAVPPGQGGAVQEEAPEPAPARQRRVRRPRTKVRRKKRLSARTPRPARVQVRRAAPKEKEAPLPIEKLREEKLPMPKVPLTPISPRYP